MNILDIMTKIPGLGGLVDKAPQALSGFLNKLLEENKPLLDIQAGEAQMFYIMFPQPEINEYIMLRHLSVTMAPANPHYFMN